MQRSDGPTVAGADPRRSCRCSTAQLGPAEGVRRGAYMLRDGRAADARSHPHRHRLRGRTWRWPRPESLQADGIRVRVVSMPSWELFAAQPESYRDEVLPAFRPRPGLGRSRRADSAGIAGRRTRAAVIAHGRDFGASAPGERLFQEFGVHPDGADARMPVRPGSLCMANRHEPGILCVRAGRAGTEPLVRLHHPRPGHLGRAGAADPGGRALGMTSNPTIFEKAVAGSALYDEDIRRLGRAQACGPREIFEALAVARCAGRLRRIPAGCTGGPAGRDGLVSLEVSPDAGAGHRRHHRARPSGSGPRSIGPTP